MPQTLKKNVKHKKKKTEMHFAFWMVGAGTCENVPGGGGGGIWESNYHKAS